ncbi:MFS transporter [Rhodococcus sp. NPDC058521]|uniref:MFS transporter n=1 Tax=Rhodococcus sp. NPDC058521 TaxID=3346536 RepID=UPI00365E15B8
MTTTVRDEQSGQTTGTRHPAIALLVLAGAQFMVVLDATIVNIALPSIQSALGFSAANLAWVVNAYAIAFGGLLLLGGRAGDLFGRRRMFVVGVVLFAAASLIGGFATTSAWLIIARVAQGVGAAIAAPAALSLITVTFDEGKARNRALAVYAAMSGVGAAIGLLAGGLLTEYISWRWVLFVNVPIGLAVLVGIGSLPSGSRGTRGRIDIPGAISGTFGLTALVYAITRGEQHGWTDAVTLSSFGAAVLAIGAFVLIQARTTEPLMPLHLFANRSRAGAFGTMLIVGAGMFAMFYFLSLFMQKGLGYSPVETGLAYLPFTVAIGIASVLAERLVARIQVRFVIICGLALATLGTFLLTRWDTQSEFWPTLVTPMVIIAFGLGLTFVPLTISAVSKVEDNESGIASAILNAAQQIGGALGLAILSTLATHAADSRLVDADSTFYRAIAMKDFPLLQQATDALVHGYGRAFWGGACILLIGVIVAIFTGSSSRATEPEANPAVPTPDSGKSDGSDT